MSIAESRVWTAKEQLTSLANTLFSLASSLTEKRESLFRQIRVTIKNERGEEKCYKERKVVIDPLSQKRVVVTSQEREFTYIEDVKRGDLYLNDTKELIRMKCLSILLGLPFYSLFLMSIQSIKLVVSVFDKTIDLFKVILLHCHELDRLTLLKKVMVKALKVSSTFLRRIYEVVKVPLFAISCALAALYGVFSPYQGRVYEAQIERAWQQGMGRGKDFSRATLKESDPCCVELTEEGGYACYLALCFQPHGNRNDPNITIIG